MKKRLWILNHYATNMFFEKGGRHYSFAKYLLKKGYEPTIFCANTRHNKRNQIVVTGQEKWKEEVDQAQGIPFVFVNSWKYEGNGLDRVINMFSFYKNLFVTAREYAKIHGTPDLVIASSVHPLTLVAGIRIAKKFGVQCICEVRDLWPETLVAYGSLKANSILAKLLYAGEKWIYKKADKLIFTMEGGKDYILDKGWDKEHGGPIDIEKVYHINNGVDLEDFEYNKNNHIIQDDDLENDELFKVIYTGSIRRVNKVGKLLDAAKLIPNKKIRFLIWGDGDELASLKKRIIDEKIDNVIFKGWVEKKYIPSIVSRANLNIILGENLSLYRYGGSMNKMFDYFASGKPVLITNRFGYSLVERYRAGEELEDSAAINIVNKIMHFRNLDANSYETYCNNSKRVVEKCNFKTLVDKLVDFIES
ncbi:glycosyltransferase family 4 protein [Mesotoga sp.]|uniref:glycosyltransferase family 4 protein n=1 Tax=Mesotoga sp. TaxID=2053577 RepID=UPI00345EF872